MIHRNAVRALVLSHGDDRLLLAKMRVPDRGLEIWLAPGGGIEDGESAGDCLIREVYEETGFEVERYSGPVWLRTHRFKFLGKEYVQHEEYYVVRTPHFEADGARNPARQERELVDGFRWWRLESIRKSDEIFVPRRLAFYLEQILVSGPPAEPIDVGV